MINMFKHIVLFFVFGIVLVSAQQPQHFTFTTNTGNNGIVSIPAGVAPKANNAPILIGDEIGVFTQQGLCVGAAVWTGENIGITIWGDDDRTAAIDGLGYNEKINFKIWKKADNKEYGNSEAIYSTVNPMYRQDGLYAPNAFYVLTSLKFTGAPFAPSLIYPANGTASMPNVVIFSWTKPEVTASYVLQIATDTLFSHIVINDTNVTANSKEISTLSKTTKYFWRVAAKNIYGTGDWSSIWSFTTITDFADRPVLTYPANNSISIPTNTLLSWNPSPRAQYYVIEIAFDENFNMMYKVDGNITKTYYQLENLSNYVKYYWRVSAFNESGYSQYSQVFNFTTIPNPPMAISPANGQKGVITKPVIEWSSVPNAVSYNLIISTNPTDGSATILNRSNIIGTQYEVYTNLDNDRTYYWKVNANMQGGVTEWSEVYSFKTRLQSPLPFTPNDFATGVSIQPVFSWGSVTNADSYHLQISVQPGDFSIPIFDQSGINGMSFTPSVPLKGLTKYYWHISAVNSEGESDWSLTQEFSTIQTAPDPPQLLAPANNTSGLTLTPTFVWQNLNDVNSYNLQISTDRNNWSTLIVDRPAISTNTFTLISELQYYTVYYWRVAAANNIGLGQWSSPNKFTTKISDPYITSPQEGTRGVSVTPVISWSAVPGATSYNLQILTNASNPNSAVVYLTALTSNSVEITTPLNYSSTYYVRVAANSLGGQTAWSNAISFITTMASAELLSPNNGALGISLTPTLAWSSVSSATAYQLQVSTAQDNWSSPIVDRPGITSNFFTLTSNLQNYTTYYWRVRAVNLSETSDWSEIRSFTTIIKAPITTYPVDNSNWNDLLPQFVWSAVSGASSYTLQVSTNITDWSSPLMNLEGLQGSTYISPIQLANNTTYYWRMCAVNTGGKSEWSEIKSFKTLPAYPSSFHLQYSIVFPHYTNIADYKATDYKLMGLPGADHIPLGNVVKGTQKKDWNAYWDNGQQSNYMIEYDKSDIFTFSLGKAFWILSNTDINIDRSVSTSTLNSKQEIEIPLHPGWNIITNPFTSAINWESIQQKNNISDPLWKYEGKFETSSVFEPYKGYYFDNKNGLSFLKVPYFFTLSANSTPVSHNGQIEIPVKLSADGKQSGIVVIGISDKANKGIDDMDFKKPKTLFKINNIALNISCEPDNDYASDIRNLESGYEKWDFTITSITNGTKSIEINNISAIPAIYEACLFDHAKQKTINLRMDSVYKFSPLKELNKFSIMIGKREEIEKEVIQLTQPVSFEIMQNYPNPFNPETMIPVKIPKSGRILLSIFDILGKEVIKLHEGALEPGNYTFEWKGKDKSGNNSPSGIYFVRMISLDNNIHQSRKIMLVK